MLVTAVMLVNGRHHLVGHAVQCFQAQTYENKILLIWDTGVPAYCPVDGAEIWREIPHPSIGGLRNEANAKASGDIIVHFDSDDYSHPNRIAEQVSLLLTSGAECVGYREMLFWQEQACASCDEDPIEGCEADAQAWIYSNPNPRYCLGTSLCYWRSVWERRPFPEMNGRLPRTRGEDREWLREVRSEGAHAVLHEPRMIARIHAGNAQHYTPYMLDPTNDSWRRAPEWDERVRRIMEG